MPLKANEIIRASCLVTFCHRVLYSIISCTPDAMVIRHELVDTKYDSNIAITWSPEPRI